MKFFNGMRYYAPMDKTKDYLLPPHKYWQRDYQGSRAGATQGPYLVGLTTHSRRLFMSCLVSNILNGEDISGKYYQQFKKIVTVARDDGYMSLHIIMRMVY